MTVEANKFVDFEHIMQLKTGDIVRHKDGGEAYVVTAVYASHRATAVRSVDITHPVEWEVMRLAPNTGEPPAAVDR